MGCKGIEPLLGYPSPLGQRRPPPEQFIHLVYELGFDKPRFCGAPKVFIGRDEKNIRSESSTNISSTVVYEVLIGFGSPPKGSPLCHCLPETTAYVRGEKEGELEIDFHGCHPQ